MRYHFIIFLFSLQILQGQEELRYEDYTYLPHIKSVKLHIGNLVTSEPIIDLGSSASIRLSFDDILGGDRTYTYKIIHCDKDWQPSDLSVMDYLDGFNDEEVENYSYSVGTKYDYTHYSLTLPNDDLTWRISGNYLLVVTDDDSNELAITRRFMVADRKISIGIQMNRSRKPNRLLYDQEFELTIDNQRYNIVNPQNELFLTLMQNGRWDNAITNLQPKFTVGSVINFDQTNRPSFPGYQAFRGIDLRSVNTRGFGVYSIDIYEDEIDVLLEMDYRRGNVRIQTDEDLNGDFIIDNLDYRAPHIRGEYVNVFFTLASERRVSNGDVYVIGAFNNWRPSEEFRLSYDLAKQIYHGSFLLKQGYYDYQYAVQYDDGRIDIQYFEGSNYASFNQYHVLAYHRAFGERYDQLIGVASLLDEF